MAFNTQFTCATDSALTLTPPPTSLVAGLDGQSSSSSTFEGHSITARCVWGILRLATKELCAKSLRTLATMGLLCRSEFT